MKYSVIIPAHNEADHLEHLVTEFVSGVSAEVRNVLAEIIIVENGSTDRTLDVIRRMETNFVGLVRAASIPRGSYGAAVKVGIEAATGTHLSVLECDFLDVSFVARSVDLFEKRRARFIVASKRHRESNDHRPIERRLMTKGFNVLLRLLVGYPGTDTHGLKSIETRLAKRLCALSITTDEVFQTEIVLLAWRHGVAIHEVPIGITEVRPTPARISKRVSKVVPILWQLRRSLKRFPPDASLPEDG